MTSTPLLNTPLIPHAEPTQGTTVEEFLRLLHDRNRALALENEQLLTQYEELENFINYKETIIAWQQRLICLGGEHVKLLEAFVRGQSAEMLQPMKLLSQEVRPEFRPRMCSSPLETPPSLNLDLPRAVQSTATATRIPEAGHEQTMTTRGRQTSTEYQPESEDAAYSMLYC